MSAGMSFLRSAGQAFTQSTAKARETTLATPTQGQVVVGIVPAAGFGAFAGINPTGGQQSSQSGWAYCSVTWPLVYTTMTESWAWAGTAGAYYGPGSASATTVWDTVFDSGGNINSTYSPSSGPPPIVAPPAISGWIISGLSVSDTAISATITYTDGTGTSTGTYTATLSGPIASYSTLAAAANALLSYQSIPALSSSVGGAGYTVGVTSVYSTSGSPGYVIFGPSHSYSAPYAACYYGLPLQNLPSGRTWSSNQLDITETGGDSGSPSGYSLNQGAVACAKSTWGCYGGSPTYSGFVSAYPNQVPHNLIYIQPITLGTGNVPSLGSVTPATSIASSGIVLSPGGDCPPIPVTMTFLSSDAPTANGTTYGIIGFRNPAA